MNKTEIINNLIAENGYQSYLEIGLGDGVNFSNIFCENKVGVDPEFNMVNFAHLRTNGKLGNVKSDYFFEHNTINFDLIFIDGLHDADQVERDIINSWNCLNHKGMILIHDIWPKSEEMTIVPRQTKQWTGDVFRAWHGFKETYSKIKTEEIEEEWGIGVIHKSRHKIESGFISDITFAEYNAK